MMEGVYFNKKRLFIVLAMVTVFVCGYVLLELIKTGSRDYSYPDCNVINLFSNTEGVPLYVFVTLCRKDSRDNQVYDKCELGRLLVFSS